MKLLFRCFPLNGLVNARIELTLDAADLKINLDCRKQSEIEVSLNKICLHAASAAPDLPRGCPFSSYPMFDFLNPYPEIRDAVGKVCAQFDMNYWSRCEQEQRLATEFFDAMRRDGWLGIDRKSGG